ncbi:aromatic acid exporter family protein [Aneurinibacillus sp. Ricciae_BoGa-3]|uniref:aromatic acid exporter family protein n=1 Tax=Aneurinibacillus sp. Ricciae_BoGa-3 TaxID=3022697 RepID=UPI0023420B65|nr:aromatic acid exporter family protein [Aneurinibacillus sp. Ricciae_BoGa-3]WCK52334.1 aromatic acid exporter family protein [Aneurinibacillus sp. Ricciae_BoGa-3]
MKIGYRTLKTALGTFVSIAVAQAFALQFASSAGILTILCIQVTKKRSLKHAYSRFFACLLGLVFGFVVFNLFGYHPIGFFVLFLFFIPLLVRLRIQQGFVTSSVILFHLYTVQHFTLHFLYNELSIMGIGIGTALLLNSYMPNMDRELRIYQQKIEDHFSIILKEMAVYLRNHESLWSGKELIETEVLLNQAKSLAIRNVENHLLRNEDLYYRYFSMREEQFDLIKRMVPLVSSLSVSLPQSEIIASFLDQLSENIHPGNTAYLYLDQINQMKREFEESKLPETREEFETRANLFYLLHEMERYLTFKRQFQPTPIKKCIYDSSLEK